MHNYGRQKAFYIRFFATWVSYIGPLPLVKPQKSYQKAFFHVKLLYQCLAKEYDTFLNLVKRQKYPLWGWGLEPPPLAT